MKRPSRETAYRLIIIGATIVLTTMTLAPRDAVDEGRFTRLLVVGVLFMLVGTLLRWGHTLREVRRARHANLNELLTKNRGIE